MMYSDDEEYSEEEELVVHSGGAQEPDESDENLQELLSHVPKPISSSSIPLADAAGKVVAPVPKEEPPKVVQPVIVKPPKETQMNAERVKAIAEEEARVGRQRMEKDNMEQMRAQKQFTKMADKVLSEDDQECEHLAFILNNYKKLYGKKISYNFRARYTPSIGLANLRAEKKEVDILLQVTNLPTMMGEAMKSVSEWIEKASLYFNSPYFDATGFTHDVELAVDSHYFEMEFEQLALELAQYFIRPPAERALGKWLYILVNRMGKNSKGLNKTRGEQAQQRQTLDEKLINQVADL